MVPLSWTGGQGSPGLGPFLGACLAIDIERRDVLLMFDAPVHGKENVEVRGIQVQKLAVFEPGPSHLGYCLYVVACKLAPQPPREALIE